MSGQSSTQEYWIQSQRYGLLLRASSRHPKRGRVTLMDLDAQTALSAAGAPRFPWRDDFLLTEAWKGGLVRLYGHVENFPEASFLFDVMLRPRSVLPSIAPITTVDGRAEWGDREYLFAPAHSQVLILPERKIGKQAWRFLALGKINGLDMSLDAMENAAENALFFANHQYPLGPARLDSLPDGHFRFSLANDRLSLDCTPLLTWQSGQRMLCNASGVMLSASGRKILIADIFVLLLRGRGLVQPPVPPNKGVPPLTH